MTDQDDSLLCPEEISERLRALEGEGFPEGRVETFAMELASFCRGAAAEGVLANLIELLSPEAISRLVSAEIMAEHWTDPSVDFCGAHYAPLAQELLKREFHVESGHDWVVNLPDGSELAQMVDPVEGDVFGIRLGRLALLGIWFLDMRNAPPRTPSY